MKAAESIYILSRDFQLIRQYIDYSLVTEKYDIIGIHTENHLAIENIRLNEASILVVDSISMNEDVLHIVENFISHSDVSKKSIIYFNESINLILEKKLKAFYKYFILHKSYDVLDLLYVIDGIHKSKMDVDWEIESSICDRLQGLHIATHLLGFTYLTKACLYRHKDKSLNLSQVYDKIAREHQTTSTRVDRCIRNAIKYAYEKNKETLFSFCKYRRKPSNSRFISCITLELEYKV